MKYILFCVLLCVTYATASYFESRERAKLYKENKEFSKKIIEINKQKDSLSRACDSLSDEVFMQSTIVGRYEITLDYLKTENPKAAEQFENFLTTQTE